MSIFEEIHMFKNILAIVSCCLLMSCASTSNISNQEDNTLTDKKSEHATGWLTDMDQAKTIAKVEGKDIFVFFTGSDWCGWCIKLKDEVLDKEEFLAYAKDNLVLLDLDFPDDKDILTKEQHAHNKKWREVFKPGGFPSVYLTDASAEAYAITGYQDGGVVKYVEHLKSMKTGKTAVADLMSKAKNTSGVERAKLLDNALNYKGVMINDRESLEGEILTLTENKDSTLYNKYRSIKDSKDLMGDLGSLFNSKESPEKVLEKMLATHKQYKHIKEGDALHNLLGSIGDQFIQTGKAEEGVAFMDTIVTDDSYSLDVRQSTALFKGIITSNVYKDDSKKTAESIEFFKATIAMDPEGEAAKRAEFFLNKMREI